MDRRISLQVRLVGSISMEPLNWWNLCSVCPTPTSTITSVAMPATCNAQHSAMGSSGSLTSADPASCSLHTRRLGQSCRAKYRRRCQPLWATASPYRTLLPLGSCWSGPTSRCGNRHWVAGTCQLKPLLEQRSFFTPLTVPKKSADQELLGSPHACL